MKKKKKKKKKQRHDEREGKSGIYKNQRHYDCYRKQRKELKSEIAAELPFLSIAHCERFVIDYHLRVFMVLVRGRLLRARNEGRSEGEREMKAVRI